MQKSIFLKFFYEMEDKIILKFNTKNILNFYEIEPRGVVQREHTHCMGLRQKQSDQPVLG